MAQQSVAVDLGVGDMHRRVKRMQVSVGQGNGVTVVERMPQSAASVTQQERTRGNPLGGELGAVEAGLRIDSDQHDAAIRDIDVFASFVRPQALGIGEGQAFRSRDSIALQRLWPCGAPFYRGRSRMRYDDWRLSCQLRAGCAVSAERPHRRRGGQGRFRLRPWRSPAMAWLRRIRAGRKIDFDAALGGLFG